MGTFDREDAARPPLEDTDDGGFARPERPDAAFGPDSDDAEWAAVDPSADPSADATERAAGAAGEKPERESGDSVEASTGGCVIMGPGNVGKTTLIAAIDQACHSAPLTDRPDLEFVPTTKLGDLIKLAVHQIVHGTVAIETTISPVHYPFSVATASGPGPAESMEFSILDGPGGALFPTADDELNPDLEPWEHELVDAAQVADALVLCLDATNEEHCALAHRYVPSLLGRMVTARWVHDERSVTWHRRLLAALGLVSAEIPARWSRRLRARRFLLLFTKVDLLVNAFLAETEGAEEDMAERLTPQELAARLDPVAQACHLLGEVVLRRIQSALPVDGQFAIGFCSNWGFDPYTGDPFMPNGRTARGLYGMSRQRRPADWTPFGVREAVDFIVTGTASGSVHLVDRERLNTAARVHAHESRFRAG